MRRRGRTTKEYYCDVQLCAAVFSVVGRPTQLIYILDFYLSSNKYKRDSRAIYYCC